jgi:hypothetical protein
LTYEHGDLTRGYLVIFGDSELTLLRGSSGRKTVEDQPRLPGEAGKWGSGAISYFGIYIYI